MRANVVLAAPILIANDVMPGRPYGLTSPLDHWREAFDAMHQGRVIKSVLIP